MWFKGDAGVTAVQGRVSMWANQSGNSHALQASSGSQPQLVANVINGKQVVRFDGGDSLQFIQRMDGLSGVSIFLVSKSVTDPQGIYAGGESAPLFWQEYKGWGMLFLSPYQTSVRYRFGTGEANNNPEYNRPSSVGSSFTLTSAVKSGTSERLYVDGQLRSSRNAALASLSGISDLGRIGFGSVRGFSGDIAEILVYNRALSDSERQAVEGNLRSKYFTAPPPASGIPLSPGDNVQAAINANPTGTTFLLRTGVHRHLQLTPKSGNVFIGEPGTVLSGAKVLANFTRSAQYWVASDQTQQSTPHGECAPATLGCKYNEDLFINDVPLKRVTSLGAVTTGTWFFDYATDRIYLIDDPTGKRVETSVTPAAFTGSASNVTINGIIVEKYASPAQFGAVGGQYPGPGWTIQNSTIRWNHGAGVRIIDNGKLLNSSILKNGQIGISASGANVRIEGNEIAFNHYSGFHTSWEAGAVKFSLTNQLIVRNNYSHDNMGLGLWTDEGNIDTLYEGNTVTNNAYGGISHEISYSAVIRNNTVKNNGASYWPWLWGGQIQVQNSQNVEVYGNQVTVGANGGNGIVVIQQSRGSGPYGPYLAINNYIHDNHITYLGSTGMSGGAADWNHSQFFAGNNVFNLNHYHTLNPNNYNWAWSNSARNWTGFRSFGLESSGTIDSIVVP